MSAGMKVISTFIYVLLAGAVICLSIALFAMVQHQRDLEANGCREQVRAKTGKRILVGKISRDEVVVVYECANGRRVEFQ